jgi:hypothetical protein
MSAPAITPERIAELSRIGVVLAQVELIEQFEHKDSEPVTMRSRRNDDGTWELIFTRYPAQ